MESPSAVPNSFSNNIRFWQAKPFADSLFLRRRHRCLTHVVNYGVNTNVGRWGGTLAMWDFRVILGSCPLPVENEGRIVTFHSVCIL